MANLRLYDPAVRIYLASPLAFDDWQNPTTAELNANPTNDPNGLIWNITCAVDRADSNFDLGDAEVDDSLSFCQVSGTTSPTSFNPDIALSIFRSTNAWVVSDPETYDTANLAFSLLAWRGVDYFVIISVGERFDEEFSVDDRLKMARMGTSDPVDNIENGGNITMSPGLRNLGDINWNYRITA